MSAPRDFSRQLPEVMDRITYTLPDSSLRTGYVMAINRSPYTGNHIIWIEPEQDFIGNFIPVPLAAVIDSDARGAERRRQLEPDAWLKLLLCDLGGAGHTK